MTVPYSARTTVTSTCAYRCPDRRPVFISTMRPLSRGLDQATGRRVTARSDSLRWPDRAVDRILRRSASLPESPTISAWAALKLSAVVSTSPVLGAVLFATLPLETKRCRRRAQRLPGALRTSDPDVVGRSAHLDPGGRYLVTSDLHRCIPGGRDWPRRQATSRQSYGSSRCEWSTLRLRTSDDDGETGVGQRAEHGSL